MAKTDMPSMKLDFEKMIGQGEMSGADGFRAETPNGSARWRGTGWNRGIGGGWAAGSCCTGSSQVEPDATRRSGRSNRTGE